MPKLRELRAVKRKVERGTAIWCKDCAAYRPRSTFHKNTLTPTGFMTYCKDCCKVRRNLNRRKANAKDQ